ncbi:MAG: Rpn family recombination-promoting nuclease/putative transposase [Bacteroidaceae bacterium]|nr:Rpn family recombination-promoting nuclease/putative transposase [Bacteroidaceae bacterium]
MEDEKYIRFDWAAKRILRQKANYGVLEGLVTVLLGEPIKIVELLESESNQDDATSKFNRIDIKARNSKGEIILVEIQLTRELDFLQRILFGVSKAITEHIFKGEDYTHVKKVYSINILYFDLGQGKDYLYHGKTEFRGVHTQDTLLLGTEEEDALRFRSPSEIFPEYYLIRVNEFNQVATTPLEEWLDFLKNARIKDDTTTPGLNEARETLQYMKMTHEERVAYDQHIDAVRTQHSVFAAARLEGKEEGRTEGRAEGAQQTNLENARKMKAKGYAIKDIADITGLTHEQIEQL